MPGLIALLSLLARAARRSFGGGPSFEVATLKQSPPPTGDFININLGTFDHGKVTLTNASLSDCLKLAWGIVSDDQLSGPGLDQIQRRAF